MMRMYDLIHQKRQGEALTAGEIKQLIDGYVAGTIPDYQMSAFAMAVCFQGMSAEETTALTMAMTHSGKVLEWSDIPGVKVDKHSTGGVGDTTTLILAPLVASVGVPIAKMSGRGLGHTGGTLDKLESIPGFTTELSQEKFRQQVKTIGVAVAGQTADLAPADKKLYALRDVTDTVESIPLIASSIMSKKLASGADAIVLDVKVGEGAFMKTEALARQLAETMVAVGHLAKRETVAVLTRMDEPLGRAIGNALEVREAIQTLRNQGPEDLTELCLILGSEMVVQGGQAKDAKAARKLLETALSNGQALAKFKEFVTAQGGDARVVDDLTLLPHADVTTTLCAEVDGVILKLHAEAIGLVAMRLGAGRSKHDDVINPAVGLVLQRKVGQSVKQGEALVEVHAASQADAERALAELKACIEVGKGEPFTPGLVLQIIRARDIAGTSQELAADQMEIKQMGEAQHHKSKNDAYSLLEAAKAVLPLAYVAYSKFAVGAAIALSDGQVVTGVNVENASYGLSNCAERSAVFRAISSGLLQGDVKIVGVAVIADSNGPVAPCGACRQVLVEFCDGRVPVTLGDLQGHIKETTMGELLPGAFGAAQMRGEDAQ